MASKTLKKFVTPAIAMFAMISLGALTAYVKQSGPSVPSVDQVDETSTPAKVDVEPPVRKAKEAPTEKSENSVMVMTPHEDSSGVTFKASSRKLKSGEDGMLVSVQEGLKLISAVPKDARVLSIERKGSQAIVQVNDKFSSGYGTDEEAAILESIRQTLAQFPEIQTFTIECEGKQLTTLGQFDLTKPVNVRGTWDSADGKDEHP